jgi:hypothetical protein
MRFEFKGRAMLFDDRKRDCMEPLRRAARAFLISMTASDGKWPLVRTARR